MTANDMPITFYKTGTYGYMAVVGRARYVFWMYSKGRAWEQRGERVAIFDSARREVSPMQILLETGCDPWSYPLTEEDRKRYESHV